MPKIIVDTEKIKMKNDAIMHDKKCICAGCFLNWIDDQERRERIHLLNEISNWRKLNEELRREGKLPPDDRVYSKLVA